MRGSRETRRPWSASLACCAGLQIVMSTGCVALALLAAPAAAAAGGPVVAHRSLASRGQAEQTRRFWTPERMKLALRHDLSGDRKAGPGSRKISRATASHVGVVDPSIPPYRVNGRVFVRIRRGVGSCSGTAVDSPSRRVVFTAGHCVNDGYEWWQQPGAKKGAWATRWMFVPAFNYGQGPFGSFPASDLWALPRWIRHSNFNFDVAAAAVYPNEVGQNLEDALAGAATLATSQPYEQQFQIFGYPAGTFGGQALRECDSGFLGSDRVSYELAGPLDMRAACDMARGSSGGGWLINGGTTLNGVTSRACSRNYYVICSPYFGAAVQGLYNQVANR